MVIRNNSLPLECINKSTKEKMVKKTSTFDFSALYTNIPHDKLVDILHKVVHFELKGGARDYIVISKQRCT